MFNSVFAPFHGLQEFFRRLWDGVAGVFEAAWDKITGFVQTAWDKITAVGGGVLAKLLAGVAEIGGPLLAKVFGTAAQGADAGANELAAGVDHAVTAGAEPYLPQSDAQRGPFSRLTEAGAAIPTTMAAGVVAGAPQLGRALDQTLLSPAGGGIKSRGAADLISALRDLTRELRASREEHRDRGGSLPIGSVDLRLDHASELWSLLDGMGGALGRSYG